MFHSDDFVGARWLASHGPSSPSLDSVGVIFRPNSEDEVGWHSLGIARRRVGDLDGAARAIAKAIDLSPIVPEFHNTLGVILACTGRHEEAIAKFRHALSLRPEYPEAISNIGVSLPSGR